MKESVLFKHHKKNYKKFFGTIPFVFETNPSLYPIVFMTGLLSGFLLPANYQFFFSLLFSSLCVIAIFIHANMINKAKKSFSKEADLGLRQTIASNILNEFDSYLKKENIFITEISRCVIENFQNKIYFNLKKLLSDNRASIEDSFIYFFDYHGKSNFTYDLTCGLKEHISTKEKEFKKELINSKNASLGEERLKSLNLNSF